MIKILICKQKFFKRAIIAAKTVMLVSCANFSGEPVNKTEFGLLETQLEELAQSNYRYLSRIKVPPLVEEKPDFKAINFEFLRQSHSKDLAKLGVDLEKQKFDRLFLSRYFTGKSTFDDFYKLSEFVVLANVGPPIHQENALWSGPYAFELVRKKSLKNDLPEDGIFIRNAMSSHEHVLRSGMDCVFFLSKTYRDVDFLENADSWGAKYGRNIYPQHLPIYCKTDTGYSILTSLNQSNDFVSEDRLSRY